MSIWSQGGGKRGAGVGGLFFFTSDLKLTCCSPIYADDTLPMLLYGEDPCLQRDLCLAYTEENPG